LIYFPVSSDAVMVRIENLADQRFDNSDNTFGISLYCVANKLWLDANPDVKLPNVGVYELSLTGN
jgi:hypothetical protein